VTRVRAWPQAHPNYWRARAELVAAQLIAYQRPLYQVLALARPRAALQALLPLGQMLRQMERTP
jgi:hypothetical protein